MTFRIRPVIGDAQVRSVIEALSAAGIDCWVDGGWGVDALMGRQTRGHEDVDLAIPLINVVRAVEVMEGLGLLPYEDELPTRLELRSEDDRRVDLHPLTFDEEGNGLQQLQDGTYGVYGQAGLAGRGTIDGRDVRCLSAELQLLFHQGYEPNDNDRHDVSLLVERFGLPAPSGYG